jgi:AhpD family alkylhydroperoxidase
MAELKVPSFYEKFKARHGKVIDAVESLGMAARDNGPLDEKTSHLVQLAAAATIRSEGSVHSHVRRALNAGASADEIYHTLVLLISTIGFPTVAAAMSWADDVIKK